MSPDARAHYDRGLALYAERSFLAAVEELERGFAIEPRREFLFAEAQALRLAGACERAIPLYRQFLATGPTAVQVEATNLGIDRCLRALAEAPKPPPPKPPEPTTPTGWPPGADNHPTPAPAPRPALWRDPWAALAMGVGVAALAVGSGFLISSHRARDDAEAARRDTYPEFDRLWQSARQRRVIGVSALVGGAVLVGVGGARLIYLWKSHSPGIGSASDERRAQVWLWPVADGAGVVWGKRF